MAAAPQLSPALEMAAVRRAATLRLRARRRAVERWSLRLLLLAAIVGLWQLFVDIGWEQSLFVSKPSSIVVAFYDGLVHGGLLGPLGTSLYETVLGFAISAAAGVLFGMLLYLAPLLRETVWPFIAAANSLPRLALVPVFVLWFGIGSFSRVVLVVTVVFFIVLMNTYAGMQNCSRDHLVLAKSLGASRRQLFQMFMLPAAAPTIFAGLQLGITYAFLGAVIGEMLSGGSGLGAQLAVYTSQYETASVFADLLLMGIVAMLLSTAMSLLERRLLAWRRFEYRGVS